MKKHTYIEILGIIFLTGLVFTVSCDNSRSLSPGFLEGTISIGPICPVEKVPPDPGCLPTAETYKAYPVAVYSSDGKQRLAQLNPELDGSYVSELPPGNYLVVLERAQYNIGSSSLPAEISINSLEKTILNISIDTGIR
jgi:hypothetical protein